MTEKQEAELWVGWTRDAMRSYDSPEVEDVDAIVDDMMEVAVQYADAMLDEYNDRFGGARKKRRKKRGSKREEDDDDDEDGE